MAIMLDEFQRADDIITAIVAKKKAWKDLFDRHTFFTKDHKYYLSVIAASRTKESHSGWSGWVQSRVRLLAKGIDDSDAGVACARPYVKAFDRTHHCKTEDEVERVVQGKLDYQVKGDEAAEANGDSSNVPHVIFTTTFYIGITLQEGKSYGGTSNMVTTHYAPGGGRQLDISYPVSEFKRNVMASTSYDENLNSIRIVHTRKYGTPLHLITANRV
jgi:poly(A) polymerase